MLRRLLSLVFVAAIAISGCTGSAELKPTDQGKSLTQDEMQQRMEESRDHMPKEFQGAKMPVMMPDMSKAPGTAGAPAGPSADAAISGGGAPAKTE